MKKLSELQIRTLSFVVSIIAMPLPALFLYIGTPNIPKNCWKVIVAAVIINGSLFIARRYDMQTEIWERRWLFLTFWAGMCFGIIIGISTFIISNEVSHHAVSAHDLLFIFIIGVFASIRGFQWIGSQHGGKNVY